MADRRATRTGRRVLIAVVLVTVAVGAVIVATVPRGEPRTSVAVDRIVDAAVEVRVVVDSIDANRGAMAVRVAAAATGGELPSGGITVLSDIEGLGPLQVVPDSLVAVEAEGEIRFDHGNVSAYPFDGYDGTFEIAALTGSPTTIGDVEGSTAVPLSITMVDAATGFDIDAVVDDSPDSSGIPIAGIDYRVDRVAPVLVWASVMMAIYWLLTAAIVAVTLAALLGYREWETRHLAWLAAMIFAFTSFRGAAPDSPPIGVYFDFASFFWAQAIVAICLAAMVVNYLVGRNIAGLQGPAVPPEAPGDPGP